MLHLTTKPLSVHYQLPCLSHSTFFKFQKHALLSCVIACTQIVLLLIIFTSTKGILSIMFPTKSVIRVVTKVGCLLFIKVGFILKENNEHVTQKFDFIIVRVQYAQNFLHFADQRCMEFWKLS